MNNCNNIRYCCIKGPKGEKGDKGEPGPSTIQIGSVETINPSEEAQVINVGTPVDVVLDLKYQKVKKENKVKLVQEDFLGK